MLRSLGIPAREAVGYVPGGYDPITDLYQVRADDAHAWVQVWFPGYGWQSFDPTAVVPPANAQPGRHRAARRGRARCAAIPFVPVAAVLLGAGLVVVLVRWRRSRPATWAGRVARRAERAGRRAGRPRRPGETLVEYATDLDDRSGQRVDHLGPAGLVGGGERLRGPRSATRRHNAPWSPRPGERGCGGSGGGPAVSSRS